MYQKNRIGFRFRLLLLVLFAILLFCSGGFFLSLKLYNESCSKVPLIYLPEPVRNDQTWDSIDI